MIFMELIIAVLGLLTAVLTLLKVTGSTADENRNPMWIFGIILVTFLVLIGISVELGILGYLGLIAIFGALAAPLLVDFIRLIYVYFLRNKGK
jgi:hypothetical protein